MLDATVLRHTAIAQNIANVETPRYRRVDLAPSFQAELRRAIGSGNATQIAGVEPGVSVDMRATPATRDGNTVRLEEELMNLSQNTLQHGFETQLVTNSLLKLRLAITGRAS